MPRAQLPHKLLVVQLENGACKRTAQACCLRLRERTTGCAVKGCRSVHKGKRLGNGTPQCMVRSAHACQSWQDTPSAMEICIWLGQLCTQRGKAYATT